MKKGWLLAGVLAALMCAPAWAENITRKVQDIDAKVLELERKIDEVRKTAAETAAQVKDVTGPAQDVVEDYLQKKGVTGMAFVYTDAEGHPHPLNEVVQQISLSGGLRMRCEYMDNLTDFTDSTDDEMSFVTNRLDLGIGLQFNEKVEAKISLIGNYLSGGASGLNNFGTIDDGTGSPYAFAASVADKDTLAIYEAYVAFKNVSLLGSFRYVPIDIVIGRQELAYDKGFLLGNEAFGPGLSWDAVRAVSSSVGLRIDLFAAKLVENDAVMDLAGNLVPVDGFDTNVEADVDLFGIYANYTGIPDTALGGYVLYLRSGLDGSGIDGWTPGPPDDPLFNMGVLDNMSMVTLGLRAEGKFAGSFDYNAEIACQLGSRTPVLATDSESISSLGGVAELKYTMQVPWKPAIGLTYAFGTGDDDPTDNDYTRFDPLFQYNHACFGLSDMLKTSNIHIIGLTASAKPNDSLQFGLGYFLSMAADKDDPMAGGINWGATADDTSVANEIDLWLDMEFTSRCKLQLGWAFVMPGDYAKDIVGDDDMAQRLYANLSLSF